MSLKLSSIPVLAMTVACWSSAAAMPASAQAALPTLKEANGATFIDKVDREDYVELGAAGGTADELKKGLFPEESDTPENRLKRERCERIISAGFKCMPPMRSYVRYGMSGKDFQFAVGSADLPESMKQPLQKFADALRGLPANAPAIRIEGHADATGDSSSNLVLSQHRAEAVRSFLVSLGVSRSLLEVQGYGSKVLRNTADPASAENRRVEIARNLPR